MSEDLVMRSVYLRPKEDADLRQLAVDLNVTKSDLIRAAVGIKLREWLGDNSKTQAARDVEVGLRETTQARRVKQELPSSAVRFAAPKAAPKAATRKAAGPASKPRRAPRKMLAKV